MIKRINFGDNYPFSIIMNHKFVLELVCKPPARGCELFVDTNVIFLSHHYNNIYFSTIACDL